MTKVERTNTRDMEQMEALFTIFDKRVGEAFDLRR